MDGGGGRRDARTFGDWGSGVVDTASGPRIEELRTFDVVRSRLRWGKHGYRYGYVLVLVPHDPPRVVVRWKTRMSVELVANLVVVRRAAVG